MRNIQRRDIDAPAAVVGALLDRLASDDDPLWPAPAWPPIRFDRGLAVGATGGHADIHYSVTEYEPGSRLRFAFAPSIGAGHHEFTVRPLTPTTSRLTHELVVRPSARMRLAWPLAVRWLHEALLRDLLDNAELAATGRLGRRARWSPWVRLLRGLAMPGSRRVTVPAAAALARGELPWCEVMDAWRLPVVTGARFTPAQWYEAIFGDPPGWVSALMRLRNRLAGTAGFARAESTRFPVLAGTDDELLIGGDSADFALRVSILVEPEAVTCTTLTRAHRGRGRAYLALIRPFHVIVVRAMLARAGRTLLERAPSAAQPDS